MRSLCGSGSAALLNHVVFPYRTILFVLTSPKTGDVLPEPTRARLCFVSASNIASLSLVTRSHQWGCNTFCLLMQFAAKADSFTTGNHGNCHERAVVGNSIRVPHLSAASCAGVPGANFVASVGAELRRQLACRALQKGAPLGQAAQGTPLRDTLTRPVTEARPVSGTTTTNLLCLAQAGTQWHLREGTYNLSLACSCTLACVGSGSASAHSQPEMEACTHLHLSGMRTMWGITRMCRSRA